MMDISDLVIDKEFESVIPPLGDDEDIRSSVRY